jgi:hypothetical protein
VEAGPVAAFLPVGQKGYLAAYIQPADAGNRSVNWSSSDSGIAAVGADGAVTGVSEGEAVITAETEDGGFTASCAVTVFEPGGYYAFYPVTGVAIPRLTLTLGVGGSERLDAAVFPSYVYYNHYIFEQGVSWSTSDTRVASVSADGTVTGNAAGTAVVTVKTFDGGFTDTCAVTVTTGAVGGAPSTVKMTRGVDPLDFDDPDDRKPVRVVHTVWYEPEEDPRQVIGYQLEDGTPYFDHVVMLYGLRLRYRDCSKEWDWWDKGRCTKNGLHACYGPYNMYHTITNWQTYFKPIRDRGIKVLLAIVPNMDGACIGNLFESASWTQALQEQYGDYPFNPGETYRMIDELAELMKECQIDGIGFDEEYIGNWRPLGDDNQYYYISTNSANILRFCYELQAAVDKLGGTENLGENGKLIFENYELSAVAESASFTDRKGKEVTVLRNDILDYCFSQTYGAWNPNPKSVGFPRDKYGPASIALADVNGSAPKPSYANVEHGIQARMKQHLYGGYGVVMYYCLRSRDEMRIGIPVWGIAPWYPEMYGPGNAGKPEAYFTRISEMLHGQKTIYVGRDYPRRSQ